MHSSEWKYTQIHSMKFLLYFVLFLWLQHFINIYGGISVCDTIVVLGGYFTLVWRNVEESFIFIFLFNLQTVKQTASPQGMEYRIWLPLLQVDTYNVKEKVYSSNFMVQSLQYQRRHFLEVSTGMYFHSLAINWISLKELLFFCATSIIKLKM